jgi:hypothetical protein
MEISTTLFTIYLNTSKITHFPSEGSVQFLHDRFCVAKVPSSGSTPFCFRDNIHRNSTTTPRSKNSAIVLSVCESRYNARIPSRFYFLGSSLRLLTVSLVITLVSVHPRVKASILCLIEAKQSVIFFVSLRQ